MKSTSVISTVRKNIGTIVAFLGFTMLCVLTFGDLGEIASEAYWQNVKNNLLSIGIMSISLTAIQTIIKQGIGEQALQKGMNTPETTKAITDHKNKITGCVNRMVYLPYFLKSYNKRHTMIKRQEFLVNNDFVNENALLMSGSRRMIRKYNKTYVRITPHRLKWTTTDIVYDKQGQIQTLSEYRLKRAINGVVSSAIFMVGMTLLTKGLFFSPGTEPLWQKFVKLFCYIVSITIGSITNVIKEYEKGAFSVPNELAVINEIWDEFSAWEIPQWVIDDVAQYNEEEEGVSDGRVKQIRKQKKAKEAVNCGADVQEKSQESENVRETGTCNIVSLPVSSDNNVRDDGSELCRKCSGDTEPVGQGNIQSGRDTREL